MNTTKTKADILAKVETQRRRLNQNLDRINPEQMEEPGVVGVWSVKDLLAHLAEWEAMCVGWILAVRRGETPQVPAPGVTFRNLAPLNQAIYEKHKGRSLIEVLDFFHSAHEQFNEVLEGMTEEEFIEAGHFPFTGNRGLYTWISSFAAHDAWGKNEIRAWMKKSSEAS